MLGVFQVALRNVTFRAHVERVEIRGGAWFGRFDNSRCQFNRSGVLSIPRRFARGRNERGGVKARRRVVVRRRFLACALLSHWFFVRYNSCWFCHTFLPIREFLC